jgi:hypothetical protein
MLHQDSIKALLRLAVLRLAGQRMHAHDTSVQLAGAGNGSGGAAKEQQQQH